jgi:hypothetical protein
MADFEYEVHLTSGTKVWVRQPVAVGIGRALTAADKDPLSPKTFTGPIRDESGKETWAVINVREVVAMIASEQLLKNAYIKTEQ